VLGGPVATTSRRRPPPPPPPPPPVQRHPRSGTGNDSVGAAMRGSLLFSQRQRPPGGRKRTDHFSSCNGDVVDREPERVHGIACRPRSRQPLPRTSRTDPEQPRARATATKLAHVITGFERRDRLSRRRTTHDVLASGMTACLGGTAKRLDRPTARGTTRSLTAGRQRQGSFTTRSDSILVCNCLYVSCLRRQPRPA